MWNLRKRGTLIAPRLLKECFTLIQKRIGMLTILKVPKYTWIIFFRPRTGWWIFIYFSVWLRKGVLSADWCIKFYIPGVSIWHAPWGNPTCCMPKWHNTKLHGGDEPVRPGKYSKLLKLQFAEFAILSANWKFL